MNEAYSKHIDLGLMSVKFRNGTLTDEELAQRLQLEQWFDQEARNCFVRFADYLDFSHWKTPES